MKLTIHIPTALALGAIGLGAYLLFGGNSQADSRLLPFQGRLTDATGVALPDGARVVQFKMYDAPVGGTAVWAGEVQQLTVNGGLVNTMLGSKASLAGVDFATPTYLEITVDAQAQGQPGYGEITAADPPLLPRQAVVPALYAFEAGVSRDARLLEGIDVFDGDGKMVADLLADESIPPTKIVPQSVTSAQLATAAVESDEIGTGAVLTAHLADGAVTTEKLAAMAVTAAKIAPEAVGAEQVLDGSLGQEKLAPMGMVGPGAVVPIGQIAFDDVAAQTISAAANVWQNTSLSVQLQTTGRPVFVGLVARPGSLGRLTLNGDAGRRQFFVRFRHSGDPGPNANAAAIMWERVGADPGGIHYSIPPSTFSTIQEVPAGTNTWTLQIQVNADPWVGLNNVRLLAYEL